MNSFTASFKALWQFINYCKRMLSCICMFDIYTSYVYKNYWISIYLMNLIIYRRFFIYHLRSRINLIIVVINYKLNHIIIDMINSHSNDDLFYSCNLSRYTIARQHICALLQLVYLCTRKCILCMRRNSDERSLWLWRWWNAIWSELSIFNE